MLNKDLSPKQIIIIVLSLLMIAGNIYLWSRIKNLKSEKAILENKISETESKIKLKEKKEIENKDKKIYGIAETKKYDEIMDFIYTILFDDNSAKGNISHEYLDPIENLYYPVIVNFNLIINDKSILLDLLNKFSEFAYEMKIDNFSKNDEKINFNARLLFVFDHYFTFKDIESNEEVVENIDDEKNENKDDDGEQKIDVSTNLADTENKIIYTLDKSINFSDENLYFYPSSSFLKYSFDKNNNRLSISNYSDKTESLEIELNKKIIYLYSDNVKLDFVYNNYGSKEIVVSLVITDGLKKEIEKNLKDSSYEVESDVIPGKLNKIKIYISPSSQSIIDIKGLNISISNNPLKEFILGNNETQSLKDLLDQWHLEELYNETISLNHLENNNLEWHQLILIKPKEAYKIYEKN